MYEQARSVAVWDPAVYGQYADHRSRPFHDLVGRVGAADPIRIVDLGCGSGELTRTLADRWPTADVLGVDNSPEMLARAADHAGPRVSFRSGDLSTHRPGPDVDVVVSNAAFQWVPGHEAVLAAIAADLPAGGWLAVQVPGNFRSGSHVAIRELVAEPRWQDATGGLRLREDPVLEPESYADLFADAGLLPDVWETTYQQILTGDDPVLDWVRGTALRPVLTALPAASHEEFLGELGRRLRAVYPARAYGTVFGFRRIFAVGHRPD